MTEKEKMLSGKGYIAMSEELLGERQKAKELLFDFNSLRPGEVEKRNEMLHTLLGKVGENVFVEPPFRCDYGYNISLGDNFYANYNCIILDCAKVTIGNDVMFGPNVCLFAAGHPIDSQLRAALWEFALPITIGDKVWLGGNVTVTAGVTIGENTVIGAGSVVTKDIPANVVAVGNPCRVLREVTEADKNYISKGIPVE